MNTIDIIKSMDVDTKKLFIDFIEGMPKHIVTELKMKINKDGFNPSIYNTSNITLDIHSTLIQPIKHEKNVTLTTNPVMSYYQTDYCSVMHKISELSSIPSEAKKMLNKLMCLQSFDAHSIGETEAEISRCLKTFPETVRPHLSFIITYFIMPYKCKTYDVYGYINTIGISNKIPNNWFLFSIHDEIKKLINKDGLSVLDFSNIATFIYIYYKELGLTNCVDKYDLFSRFAYTLRFCDNEQNIEDIENELRAMIDESLSTGDAIEKLYCSSGFRFKGYTTTNMDNSDVCGKSSKLIDNVLFTFKNIERLNGDLSTIVNSIKRLSPALVTQYIDFCDEPYMISFDLNENDYGQSRMQGVIEIGTAYNESNSELYFIIRHENEFYVLFKYKSSCNNIYGLELTDNPNEKKIICIKPDNDFYYKYIHTI